jgi:hypothetical protein
MEDEMKIAVFRWKDSALHGQVTKFFDGIPKLGLLTLISCGIVVSQNDEQITICTDWYAGEVSFRSCQSYPKRNIEIIKFIEIPKSITGKYSSAGLSDY